MENKKKFYVTTPIYYVTAKPHLGHLYSTLLADVASRWHKIRNFDTFFLTGTDEHGQKIEEAAKKAEKSPKEFVDSFIDNYKKIWYEYEINYDYFIRTTDESHVKAVQLWIKKLQEKGDIYKSFYTGYYCTPCETYVTEKDDVKISGEKVPFCVSCGRETKYVSEESYFFKLSKYQNQLLKFYEENPDFITPSERLNEVINFVKKGLKDLSISRTTVSWGIPFQEDLKHVTYVWADALNNYITAIGYGNPAREKEFQYWWPADMQIIGKDILKFHAIYWPAFLMATKLKLPKKLLVHGWIIVNKQKMSKSFGNIVDPETLARAYDVELIRYYLIRHMAITQDAEFSIEDLENKINSDLVNDLGNLVNRMITLAHKKDLYEIDAPHNWNSNELNLRDSFWSTLELMIIDMEDGYFYRALNNLWKFINQVNSYFHASEPWKIKDEEDFKQVISATCHSLYCIAICLWPVMPKKMEELLKSLGVTDIKNFEFKIREVGQDFESGKTTSLDQENLILDLIDEIQNNPWNKKFLLTKAPLLFQKIETQVQEEKKATIANINIDEFSKVMLLVGTIEECEEIPKSQKLYKLQVNFGPHGVKQILSGIKEYFSPEQLKNKQAVFVYNLEPRKMLGLESQGMILTASSDNNLNLIVPSGLVPNGTRLK